jgi:imidazolonepropionase-like amidohydrolase
MIRNATRLAALLLGTGLIWAAASYDAPQAQAPAGGVVAFTGATVIDGTGAAPMAGATIVVSDGRIQAVGRNVTVPAGAMRVDMSGKFITPGIINAHGHLQADMSKRSARERLTAQLRMYADYGITTVQVLGLPLDDVPDGIKLRDESRPGAGGSLDRARVLIAAASLRNLKTEQEAREWGNKYADMKVDIIKMHITGSPMDMTPAVYGALIDEAHKRGIRAAAHMLYLKDAKGLLDKGIDVLAHSIRDQPVDAELIRMMKAKGTFYVPTFTVDESAFVFAEDPAVTADPMLAPAVPADALQTWQGQEYKNKVANDPNTPKIKAALANGMKNLKALQDAGVHIAFGTDSGAQPVRVPGWAEHRELELMVRAGLTPMQALTAAGKGSAGMLGLKDRGTLEPGKKADFLVLDANPLDDIRNTRALVSIWHGGKEIKPRARMVATK